MSTPQLMQAYWQGSEPKDTESLIKELYKALSAAYQWLDTAEMSNEEDRTLIHAQIFWIQQLLELSDISLKKM